METETITREDIEVREKEKDTTDVKEERDWYPLDQVTYVSRDLSVPKVREIPLTPLWKLLLCGEASVTKTLCCLTGQIVQCDVRQTLGPLSLEDIENDSGLFPPFVESLRGPYIRRTAVLKTKEGVALLYAVSWWMEDAYHRFMVDPNQPIGSNVFNPAAKNEVYRDVKQVESGHSRRLEALFRKPGPFWGRFYHIWSGGEPVTMIYEVFSPHLEMYFGSPSLEPPSKLLQEVSEKT